MHAKCSSVFPIDQGKSKTKSIFAQFSKETGEKYRQMNSSKNNDRVHWRIAQISFRVRIVLTDFLSCEQDKCIES